MSAGALRPPGPLARFCRGCATAGVAVLLLCALVTVVDIVGRAFAGWSLPGLIDLSQLLVMTSVFLCIPYTFERRANVDVDLLYARMPRVLKAVFAVAWAVASALFLGAATWHAGRAAAQVLEYGERSPTLGWPMLLYWIPVLLGCGLATIVCIAQALSPRGADDPPPELLDAAASSDFNRPR